jgi:hypothetical protein
LGHIALEQIQFAAPARNLSDDCRCASNPCVRLAITAIGVILGNLNGPHVDVTVADGKVWNTGDIYGASTLATLFTMVFISVQAGIGLYRTEE